MGKRIVWYDACTGCHESGENGSLDRFAPVHPVHGCRVGMGCRSCGGHGFRRHEWEEPEDPMAGLEVSDD